MKMTMDNMSISRWAGAWGIIIFLASCFLTAGAALAAGAPAGTIIKNTVSVRMNGAAAATTAVSSFVVDRSVSVVVTINSGANIAPASSTAALSFLVTNTSNTAMRFALSTVSKTTNTWTMNNVRIYRDNNSSGSWDAADTLYADAATFGDLATDASVTVLIVADAPADLALGQAAQYDLVATAVDMGTLNVSTQTAGANTAGLDTVFLDAAGSAADDSARDGRHSASGAFVVTVSPVKVSMNKTVTVFDQWGGSLPIPGATLRYTIAATATGSGTAATVVLSDPLPQNTAYIAGTLKLNGASLTDGVDADAGDVGGTAPNTVTVKLGTLTSLSPIQTITFDVKIE